MLFTDIKSTLHRRRFRGYKIFMSQFHSLYISNNNTLTTYIDILVDMGEQHNHIKVVFLLPPDKIKIIYIDREKKTENHISCTPCSQDYPSRCIGRKYRYNVLFRLWYNVTVRTLWVMALYYWSIMTYASSLYSSPEAKGLEWDCSGLPTRWQGIQISPTPVQNHVIIISVT